MLIYDYYISLPYGKDYMTIAFYLSPESYMCPIIVTDTVISDSSGTPFHGIATRDDFSLSQNQIIDNVLFRKYFIPNGRTAISFAGNVGTIEDFLDYAELITSDFETPRPLKLLADRAANYRAGSINVLSCLCLPEKHAMHKVKPDHVAEWRVEGVGLCAVIGSGASEISESIVRMSGSFLHLNAPEHYLAEATAIGVCIDSLRRELYFSQQQNKDESWGGILEYIIYDRSKTRWTRQPKTAYFFYELDLDDLTKPPQRISKSFYYEPGYNNGFLYVASKTEAYCSFVLYPIRPIYPKYLELEVIDWQQWKPDRLAFCMVGRKGGEGSSVGSVNYVGSWKTSEISELDHKYESDVLILHPKGEKFEKFLLDGIKALTLD